MPTIDADAHVLETEQTWESMDGADKKYRDIWRQEKQRLRWAAVVSLLTMDQALAEARCAKENGACAIFMRGTEGDRLLSDPYFYPLYEEAQRLDIAVGVHAANGSATLYDYYKYESVGFSKFKLNCVGGFHSMVMDRIPERFPKLRIGFLEISAEWLPYAYTDLSKRLRIKGKELPRDFMKQDGIFVACETTDDIPYIVSKLGEDNIVIGADYAHADSATELLALHNLSADPRLTPALAQKIVGANAQALYGLQC